MNSILLLDNNTVDLIAAGEVVENPAAVVKELAENALDAGADQINIEITGGGRDYIAVEDNGQGIAPDDLPKALLRHATSKIRNAEDLYKITTMGFRGEALPSIAAVSKVTLITRTASEISASSLKVEAGKASEASECAASLGTKVEVRDLFFNTPARLKFLSSSPAESARISKLVTALALANSQAAFSLRSEGRAVIKTAGTGKLEQAVLDLFGKDSLSQLTAVSLKDSGIHISGLISTPQFARRSRARQYLFVNRRPIDSRALRYSLESGYEGLITSGRYPWGCIFVQINPSLVDVNVHPAKREVKFKDTEKIKKLLNYAVRDALTGVKQVMHENFIPPAHTTGQPSRLPFNFSHQQMPPLRIQETSDKQPFITSPSSPESNQSAEKPEGYPVRALGQAFGGYIIAVYGNELLVIDQHAAHERILYEEFKQQGADAMTQQVIPYPIELPPAEAEALRENILLLTETGLMIDEFGNNTFIIREVPFFVKNAYNRRFVEDLIQLAAAGKNSEELQKEILAAMACKAAIKITDPLPILQQESLIKRLFKTNNPFNCPHGRPTMLRISKNKLETDLHRKGG